MGTWHIYGVRNEAAITTADTRDDAVLVDQETGQPLDHLGSVDADSASAALDLWFSMMEAPNV